VDLGSYNGTRLDGERLQPNAPKPFRVGSTVHLGAWTAIRLESANPEGAR
jgi:pSer/pThr/pTyr-binding forkhead associated (FHA) protein